MSENKKNEDFEKNKKDAEEQLKSLKFSKVSTDELKRIFSFGINIDLRDQFNETPLVKSILANNTEAACYLIKESANLYATDLSGATTMMICCRIGNLEIAKALLEKGYDLNKKVELNTRSVLHHAIDNNNVQMVKWLLNNGAFVDSETDLGWTPLMTAAMNGNVEIVAELLHHNADREHKETSNLRNTHWTALDIAEFYQHSDVVAILQEE